MEPNNYVSSTLSSQLLGEIWKDTYQRTVQAGIGRCNIDDLAANKAWARAVALGQMPRRFEPANSAADRAFEQKLDRCRAQLNQLKELRRIRAARLDSIRQQVASVAEPRDTRHLILMTGTGAFTLAFAPGIFAVFGTIAGDAVLGWVFSAVVGALIGGYLMLNLLASEQNDAKPTTFRWPAIVVGVAFGLLRLSKADDLEGFLVAAGLTALDVAIVVLAEHYVVSRSEALKHFRESQSLRIGQEASLADVDHQIAQLEATETHMINELQKREADLVGCEHIAEAAMATSEAAYRAAVAYVQQLLEGGSPSVDLMAPRLPEFSLQGGGR